MARPISHRAPGERYTVLRLIGGVFTVLGVLLLLGGCLLFAVGLYGLLSGGAGPPPSETPPFSAAPVNAVRFPSSLGGSLSILWSFGLLISGLQFLAMGALFRLVIHVEENTRVTARCLEQMRARLDPVEQGVASMFRS